MALPKWAGRNNKVGPYRLRVFWFRILTVIALIGAGSFVQAWVQDKRDDELIASLLKQSLYLEPNGAAANIDEMPIPPSKARQIEQQTKDLAANQRVERILEAKKISIHFSETPFFEAIDVLREKTDLNYIISEDARQLIRSESVRVSLKLTDISVKNAIQLVLSSHQHLEYRVEQGFVLISQGGIDRSDLIARFYNVRNITKATAGVRLSPEILLDLLRTTVIKEEILNDESLQFVDDILYCHLTESGQRSVFQFLATLTAHQQRLVNSGRSFADPWWSIYGPESREEAAWVVQIHKKLASTKLSFYFHKAPLSKIVSFFEEKSGLQFVIAPEIDHDDIEIDLRLKQVPLDIALKQTLKKAELSYALRNNVINIIPEGSEEEALALDFIGIQDIIVEDEEDTPAKSTASSLYFGDDEPYCVTQLLSIIRSDSGMDSWAGDAFIRFHKGQLIIFQTEEKIHKARKIIAQLRRAKQSER